MSQAPHEDWLMENQDRQGTQIWLEVTLRLAPRKDKYVEKGKFSSRGHK